MEIRIPEKKKKPGVCYAVTEDGIELPVIDVMHPAFVVAPSGAALAELTERFIRDSERRKKVPAFLERLLLRLVLRRSTLARGLMAAQGTFLSGMGTYLMKLGPDNLGRGYTVAIDRKIAASLPALSVRLRLQDMARLLADGLAPALRERPGRTCHLLNIGGGPAADSLNALILLRKERPELLVGRRILIHVLDLDEAGPTFGSQALGALLAEGAKLHGLDIGLRHVRYDWDGADGLREVLLMLGAGEAVVAGSSEGGLFEYGSDEAIVANLSALREGSPGDTVMVGSVTRADGPARHSIASTQVSTRLRGLEAWRGLAGRAGWAVARCIDGPFSHHVGLVKG